MTILYGIAHFLRNLFWKLTRANTVGVRVIVRNKESVLLVKHSYKDGWHLPGGGVKPGETLKDAAKREVMEETGVKVTGLRMFGTYTDLSEGRTDHIIVFVGKASSRTESKSAEIQDAVFVNTNNLPENTGPGTRRRIEELRGKPNSDEPYW